MIFDFYLSYCFDQSLHEFTKPIDFGQELLYQAVKGEQTIQPLDFGSVTALHRRNYADSYAESSEVKMWLFGWAFTTNDYAASLNRKPYKLIASEILSVYISHPQNFYNYLKGSFVLIFVNEPKRTIQAVTDRLNVLPLYYAFDGKRLIVSSNTAFMLKADWISKEIDPLALTMQSLFDYMLGEYYFVKGIRRCENASVYNFSPQGLTKTVYWDVSELYHEKLFPKKESLDLLAEQLKTNVNLYASDCEKILVSLTGGFDGRTNVAMLERPLEDFLCYSYGMPGSRQIRVPQAIAQKTGIHYRPVLLEREFIDAYYEYTQKASYFSNGTAPVGFCNIPYAFERLTGFSDMILTGLFGSEILRPLHNNGIQVNDQSFEIFLAKDFRVGINHALNRIAGIPYFAALKVTDQKDELNDYFQTQYFEKYSDFDPVTRFFFFIIQEGIRKYFSQEISIERVYVTTRFPYFDVDLVDLIYQTPWAGMYNGFLGENKFKRRKGQLLYAHIIKKYKPSLGRILLDRGYTPNDLLLPFPINYLKIGYGIHGTKKYMRHHGGNDTFKTESWALPSLQKISQWNNSTIINKLFDDRLSELLIKGSYSERFLTFCHLSSIKSHMEYCEI